MRFRPRFGSILKRPVPGIGVERWLLLLFAGITIVGLSVGDVLVDICRSCTFPSVIYYPGLRLTPGFWPGLLWGVAGVATIPMAILQPSGSPAPAFGAPGQSSLADIFCRCGGTYTGPP